MYRQQNHQRRARPWADSNHRSPVHKTGALTTMLRSDVTEVSRSTFTDTVMVKKPKGPMRIRLCRMYRQQNHQRRARPSADSNHQSPFYKTGALTTMLQSHVTEVSRSTFTDTVMVKKP